MLLTPITEDAFDVVLDIRYATADNLVGRPVYREPRCYLHPDGAARLKQAADLARLQGLRLKVFDGYRPPAAQWVFWNHNPDPDFLADPRKGSPHARGAAVDLTLIDGKGRELDMGTGFDAFTPRSHHGHPEIGGEAQKNRLILLGLMTTAGWDFYQKEWWHYQLFDARARYPLIADGAAAPPLM